MTATRRTLAKGTIPLALLLVLSACGGDGSTDPDRLAPEQLIGTWTLRMDDSGCSPDFDGDVTHFFRIDAEDAERASGGEMVVANRWSRDADFEPDHGITGTIFLDQRRFTLNLFLNSLEDRIDFDGSELTASRMEGTFTDNGVNHFGTCRGTAVATRG